MMVADEHLPLVPSESQAAGDHLPAALKSDPGTGAPEDVRSSVDRVGQQPVNRIVARWPPLHDPSLRPIDDDRQIDALLPQPHGDLSNAADLAELVEHQGQRLSDPTVGVLFQAIVGAAQVADCHRGVEVAARRLDAQRLLGTLAENRQLELAEGALHAEQQPVVDEPRIIDPVLVDDQAVHEGAELQKRVPVSAIARQSRYLEREHRAGGARADRREQPLEAWPGLAAAGSTEIVVDHDHVLPAKRLRSRCEGVLATSALRVVEELICRRLPNIDIGAARQMLGRDPIHRRSRPIAAGWRLRTRPSAI